MTALPFASPSPLDAPLRVHAFASECVQWQRAYRACSGPRVALVPRTGRALIGQGHAARLQGSPSELLNQLHNTPDLRARLGKHARFVGALAFDTTRAPGGVWAGMPIGQFVLPRLQWLAPDGDQPACVLLIAHEHEPLDALRREHEAFEARAAAPAYLLAPGHLQTLDAPARDYASWQNLVHSALDALSTNSLRKVVVAREQRLRAERPIEPALLLEALSESAALRFAIDVHDATFIGGSPELLLRKRGALLDTEALAGSEPRSGQNDAEEIARLTASAKDLREHALVFQAISAALADVTASLTRPQTPQVRTLPTVHHLHTPIQLRLSREAHTLELANLLHPTPAVCGTPQAEARRWLAENEPLERGYYAGPVGWFDAHGDGELFVALRSGLLKAEQIHIFAGAGLVPGSIAEREFAEVEAKLQVMRHALSALLTPSAHSASEPPHDRLKRSG